MIRINLLPHREVKRAARRRDFYVMSGLAFGAAVVVVVLVAFLISGFISNQEDRNNFIKQENTKLDEQIKEIAALRQEIDALKARQQAVEDLQGDRNLPVHLLDELVKQVPEGIYLTSIRQENMKVSLVGLAQSNERVSELLRNLGNNSAWLNAPELIEIRAVSVAGKRLYQFSVNTALTRPATDKDGKPVDPSKSGAAAAAPKK